MIILLLILCIGCILAFEFINGMNDTANAIAPVIYSHSLEPKKAVMIAAFLNFCGVILGGIAVAMSIMHLLPLSVIFSEPIGFGVAVVLAILLSAIVWDLGAWLLALPVSSSHALIGSILGVTIAMMGLPIAETVIPNWSKAQEVIEGLLISPILGFFAALTLVFFAHLFLKKKEYFKSPHGLLDHPTPGMRTILIAASGLVSFMHGKNDGQKGVGIATLILVILLPGGFAINPNIDITSLHQDITKVQSVLSSINTETLSETDKKTIENTKESIQKIEIIIQKDNPSEEEKKTFRRNILLLQDNYKKLSAVNAPLIPDAQAAGEEKIKTLKDIQSSINHISEATDYAPWWIIAMISVMLGAGTMIGWQRIVKTIGEKIGKHKMNYSQAASAAIVTAGTIGLASSFGLPVSTTHIMSSGVAGTMVEEHGWKNGVDPAMIKHILLAWILTLPITILMAGSFFSIFWWLFVK